MQAERNRVFRNKTYVDVAIDLLPGADEDAVLDHITRQLERVAACLPGLSASAGATAPSTGVDDVLAEDLDEEGAAGPA